MSTRQQLALTYKPHKGEQKKQNDGVILREEIQMQVQAEPAASQTCKQVLSLNYTPETKKEREDPRSATCKRREMFKRFNNLRGSLEEKVPDADSSSS